jgi:tetratricopeptide (TPR) repeat protein
MNTRHPDIDTAIRLLRSGECAKLAKFCEKALLKNNTEIELWKLYGIGLAESGSPKAARFAFIAALKLDPSDQMVLCNLIASYLDTGESELALALINNSVGKLDELFLPPLYENIMEAMDVELIEYSDLSKGVLKKIQEFTENDKKEEV